MARPGDAFYLTQGHVPHAEPGTEYLMFSPAGELRSVSEHILENYAAMHGA